MNRRENVEVLVPNAAQNSQSTRCSFDTLARFSQRFNPEGTQYFEVISTELCARMRCVCVIGAFDLARRDSNP